MCVDSERERERKRERESITYIQVHTLQVQKVAKLIIIDEINSDGRAKKYTNMSSRENNRRDTSLHLIYK